MPTALNIIKRFLTVSYHILTGEYISETIDKQTTSEPLVGIF